MFASAIELGDEDASYRYMNRAGIKTSALVARRQRVMVAAAEAEEESF